MRKGWILLLLLCFLAHASGVDRYLHSFQHPHASPAKVPSTGRAVQLHLPGAAAECPVCTLLSTPVVGSAWVPPLVILGWSVAWVGIVRLQPVTQQSLRGIECRGPPA